MKGLFKKYLKSTNKDWGNKSKSSKRSMRNAAKQLANRKFEKDFFNELSKLRVDTSDCISVEEVGILPCEFVKGINIGSIGDPNEAMDLGVRIIHDLGNGSAIQIPIEQYRFNK